MNKLKMVKIVVFILTFLLVFGSFMTRGEAMSTLMLFRIASYYFVFAASAVGTFAAQKHLDQNDPS